MKTVSGFLREYIAELEEANRQRGIFDNRGRTIAEGEIRSEQAELGRLERIQIGDPEIIVELTAEVERLDAALVKNEDTLTDLERTANRFSESQSRNFDIRRQNLEEEANALFAQRELRESELQSAQEAAKGVAEC